MLALLLLRFRSTYRFWDSRCLVRRAAFLRWVASASVSLYALMTWLRSLAVSLSTHSSQPRLLRIGRRWEVDIISCE